MPTDALTLLQALSDQELDRETRVLGRVFKVPVTLTQDLKDFLRRKVEASQCPGAMRVYLEEALQGAARAARTLKEARRVSYQVRLGCGAEETLVVDLMAALVRGGEGQVVKIGLPGDFLPKRSFIVRTNCEYSIEVKAVDEAEALVKAAVIPIAEWQAAWSEHEVESEGEVCDECRSYGPRSTCDCRR